MVFNTGPYTDLPDNSILITANMQSETGFPSSHQLKSYVAYKSRLKLAALAVLSANAGLLVVKQINVLCLCVCIKDNISRAPDVLDFFTADLQKESPSTSLVAIPSFHLSPQTADLDRAFDLYRHIRTWDNL